MESLLRFNSFSLKYSIVLKWEKVIPFFFIISFALACRITFSRRILFPSAPPFMAGG